MINTIEMFRLELERIKNKAYRDFIIKCLMQLPSEKFCDKLKVEQTHKAHQFAEKALLSTDFADSSKDLIYCTLILYRFTFHCQRFADKSEKILAQLIDEYIHNDRKGDIAQFINMVIIGVNTLCKHHTFDFVSDYYDRGINGWEGFVEEARESVHEHYLEKIREGCSIEQLCQVLTDLGMREYEESDDLFELYQLREAIDNIICVKGDEEDE